jgi:uncharacterized protein YebE (UPF0316 family)
MMLLLSMDPALFDYAILPFLIFLARLLDVSAGTLRIVFIARGSRFLAPLFGFFEVLIWLIAVRQVLIGDPPFTVYIGYAAGFTMGNLTGIYIESRLAIGRQVVRIITRRDKTTLPTVLRERGFGVTVVTGRGARGAVQILFTIIDRKRLAEVVELIHEHNPGAFFSVEDVRLSEEGIFPSSAKIACLQRRIRSRTR